MSGLTSEGKERIEAVAREHLARGWHTGAQVAVYRDGDLRSTSLSGRPRARV